MNRRTNRSRSRQSRARVENQSRQSGATDRRGATGWGALLVLERRSLAAMTGRRVRECLQ
jgi:hypothetical protein